MYFLGKYARSDSVQPVVITRIMSKINIASVKWICVALTLMLFAVFGTSCQSCEPKDTLKVLVYFDNTGEVLTTNTIDISQEDILNKLQNDLQEELSPEFKIVVSESEKDFFSSCEKAATEIANRYGVEEAERKLNEMVDEVKAAEAAHEENIDYGILQSTLEEYERAVAEANKENDIIHLCTC